MNELLDKTLSEIVRESYHAAPVFERFGLDFCCKGKRPLKKACEEKNISTVHIVAELTAALEKQNGLIDFNQISITELAEYIVRVHHTYVRENMPLIQSYVSKVAEKHGERFPYMIEVAYQFAGLQEEMREHMIKEEEVLFPRIKMLEINGSTQHGIDFLQSPMNVMEHEHENAGSTMNKIRILTMNFTPPQDACTTFQLSLAALKAFQLDLHHHVHLENNILFPKAIEKFNRLQAAAN